MVLDNELAALILLVPQEAVNRQGTADDLGEAIGLRSVAQVFQVLPCLFRHLKVEAARRDVLWRAAHWSCSPKGSRRQERSVRSTAIAAAPFRCVLPGPRRVPLRRTRSQEELDLNNTHHLRSADSRSGETLGTLTTNLVRISYALPPVQH